MRAGCLFSYMGFGSAGFGELTALCAAGVITDGDYRQLLHARGQAMVRLPENGLDAGTLLAVSGNVDSLEQFLAMHPAVQIVNRNSRTQVVVAGSKADLEVLKAELLEVSLCVLRFPWCRRIEKWLYERWIPTYPELVTIVVSTRKLASEWSRTLSRKNDHVFQMSKLRPIHQSELLYVGISMRRVSCC